MKFLPYCVVMLGCLGGAGARDQENPRHVRFLAVGDMPPFRQEIRDGVRYELEAEPGTIPPRQIQIPLDEEKTLNTILSLGAFSPQLTVPAGINTLRMQKNAGEKLVDWHGQWSEFCLRDESNGTECHAWVSQHRDGGGIVHDLNHSLSANRSVANISAVARSNKKRSCSPVSLP